MKSSDNSRSTSRIGSAPVRHFSFMDRSHSVFSRNHYYNDLLFIHPWSRRPRSSHSGIAAPALYNTPCSPHMDDLARPKLRRESHIRQGNFKNNYLDKITFEIIYIEVLDNYFNYAYSGVPPAALAAQCTPSLAELARPRQPSATTKKKGSKDPQHVPGNAAPAQPSAPTKKKGSKDPQHAPGNAAPAQPSATTKKNDSKHPQQASGNAAPAQPSATAKKNDSKHPQNASGNAAPAQPSTATKKNGSKDPQNASGNAVPAQPSNNTDAPAKSRRK
jgi:hypothetical protein